MYNLENRVIQEELEADCFLENAELQKYAENLSGSKKFIKSCIEVSKMLKSSLEYSLQEMTAWPPHQAVEVKTPIIIWARPKPKMMEK